MNNHNDFRTLDARIAAYLTAQAGTPLSNAAIAQHFGLHPTESIVAVKRLLRADAILPDHTHNQTRYYVPTSAQAKARQAAIDAIPAPRFKEYVMPQPMKDLQARLKAEREAIPSFYGEAA